jgi:hypothetical protein
MKAKLFVALVGACALLPTVSSATTYTYTQGSASDVVPSFLFTTSLSGLALDNLAPGTDITATVSAFTFQPRGVPLQDSAGFPIGDATFGSTSFNVIPAGGPPTIQIGTNALGQITSWNIIELIFASYPAFAGENVNDFFCTYNAKTANPGGGSLALVTDHNAGFCPSPTVTNGIGTFAGEADVAATPLPAALPLFAGGLGVMGLLGWRRKRKQAA